MFLLVDEIYVKPSLRLRGGELFGKAVDCEDQLARTMLGIMVKCLMGGPKFMVECVPIHTLTASFQYEKVVSVLNDIHSNGGNVVAILCDNNRINQRFFTMFPGYISLQPWKANNPYNNELPLFLLNDTVHFVIIG